jgi:hypothetical protein
VPEPGSSVLIVLAAAIAGGGRFTRAARSAASRRCGPISHW